MPERMVNAEASPAPRRRAKLPAACIGAGFRSNFANPFHEGGAREDQAYRSYEGQLERQRFPHLPASYKPIVLHGLFVRRAGMCVAGRPGREEKRCRRWHSNGSNLPPNWGPSVHCSWTDVKLLFWTGGACPQLVLKSILS
ncbi:Hypothetical predicted protein [Podarcis lilfordi]|uniref:Uncharacterized protein n=1 Tax=Podarcis lilfordi TaxID=74358 RepID=A0AA35K2A0_9SAUR|nr:Hypothetical predicted protein [Podarcis lilfordi]